MPSQGRTRRTTSRWQSEKTVGELLHNSLVPELNNPADRLAAILQAVRARPADEQTKIALSAVLGVESDADYLSSLSRLLALPGEVERRVRSNIGNNDLDWHLQWVRPVDRALQQIWPMTSQIQPVQRAVGPEHIVCLQACGNLLRQHGHEQTVAEEQLNDLREQARTLYDDVMNAESIPADLRSLLLDQLDHILRALREYIVRGPEGLAEALENSVGAFVMRRRVLDDANDRSQSFIQRFKKVAATAFLILEAANTVLSLPSTTADAAEILEQLGVPAIERVISSDVPDVESGDD